MDVKDDDVLVQKKTGLAIWSDAYRLVKNCDIGRGTKIFYFVNMYDCKVGRNCMIGCFVEIQKGVKIGNGVRIQSHSFLCEGVEVGNDVFIGHGVVFSNDRYPSIRTWRDKTYKIEKTIVGNGASIGNNVTLLPGLKIGGEAVIGAGSVVTKHVPAGARVVGNPGRILCQ